MPGGNKKGHTYLNKPAAETCSRFIHSSDCSATASLVCISSIPAAFVYKLFSLLFTFSFFWLVFFNKRVDFSYSCVFRVDTNTELECV